MKQKDTEAPLEKLLSEEEVSSLTGRSKGSLRRDRLCGRGIPYLKIQRLVRYRPADVKRYLESCRVEVRNSEALQGRYDA